MVSRTREKLIEVARQLFAYKGVDNTTMSDIATASDKGRRTIYTYFKSKREIYEATIERDSDNIVKQLRQIVGATDNPAEKLTKFIQYRFNMFNAPKHSSIGVSIDSLLNFDFSRIDKVRHKAISKEKEILQGILDDGVSKGIFDHKQTKRLIPVLHYMLQGVDVSVTNNSCHETDINDIIDFILNSLLIHKI